MMLRLLFFGGIFLLGLSPLSGCFTREPVAERVTAEKERERVEFDGGSESREPKESKLEPGERLPEIEKTAEAKPEGVGERSPEIPEEDSKPPAYQKLLDSFFQSHGGRASFTDHYVEALTRFFEVEHLYDRSKYKEAQERLSQLWQKYPLAHPSWWRAGSAAKGTNVGRPVAYYGLRMLWDMLRFQQNRKGTTPASNIILTVVLVDCLKGVQPTTKKELEEGKGKAVTLRLQPVIRANQYAVVKQSLKLFQQYIFAITGGRLTFSVAFTELSLCAAGHTQVKPYRVAGLKSLGELWPAIPESVKQKTSWWWVLYPSLVPNQYPDFKTTEFITGGMGIGPNANSPCFLIDDQWLLRKPPHLGQGPYTEIERRIYLPQWLQHEFFHHLFRIYPAFGLEKQSHQWFDRKTWPADFVGSFEPDYYAEALSKRLQTQQAQPPLFIHLRYEKPPASLNQKVTEKDVLGRYRREPKTNNWHEGVIEKVGGTLRWKNQAGVSWSLTFARSEGGLQTGPKNPYRSNPSARLFEFSFARGADGNYTTTLRGFFFNGELYRRLP